MIELYRKTDLQVPYAKVPINQGHIQGERNGYYTLSFSVLKSYLKSRAITIDHNTIFKVGNLYYGQVSAGSKDHQKIVSEFTAELLQTQVLMFKYLKELKLQDTTLEHVLRTLLEGTIFTVGACEDIGPFNFEIKNTNAQNALTKLIEETGTEIKYEELKISIKKKQWGQSATVLRKGFDFTVLNEDTDTSDVITKLYFQNNRGDLSGTITSKKASDYNFVREAYKEFQAETLEELTTLATDYLQTVDSPKVSLSISIPKSKNLDLQLCQLVRIHNTVLNKQMDYKVVTYTKSLITGEDTYQLGERKKDFADIQEVITQEVQNVAPDIIVEVIEKEVISAKTAHILNAWVRDLNVEYLETNFDALDTRKPAPLGNIRNCIRIQEECIDYVTQELSPTEVMDYKNKDGQQIYYTAIHNHPQAYQFFTLTTPQSIYPDLTDIQVDAFKVKVRKVITEQVKASFKFDSTEGDTLYPSMVWGTGTDPTGTTHHGKGFIYKDLDGLVLKYITSIGKSHEIKLGEKGIEGLPTFNFGNIELPAVPVTGMDFFSNGFVVYYGNLQKEFIWVKDSEGKILSLTDKNTNQSISIGWNNTEVPGEI